MMQPGAENEVGSDGSVKKNPSLETFRNISGRKYRATTAGSWPGSASSVLEYLNVAMDPPHLASCQGLPAGGQPGARGGLRLITTALTARPSQVYLEGV